VDGLLVQTGELCLATVLHHWCVHPRIQGSLDFRETRVVLVRSTIEDFLEDLIEPGIRCVDDVEQIVVGVDVFAVTLHTEKMVGTTVDVDRVTVSSSAGVGVVLRQVRRAELVPILHGIAVIHGLENGLEFRLRCDAFCAAVVGLCAGVTARGV